MNISIRRGHAQDARECGRICYAAFAGVANAHNFRADFPDSAVAEGLVGISPGTGMSMGLYSEPAGAHLCSVTY